MLLSCGAALHHARVALDAEGWTHRVERPGRRAARRGPRRAAGPADPTAMRRLQLLQVRRTDRRAVSDEPVPPEVRRGARRRRRPGRRPAADPEPGSGPATRRHDRARRRGRAARRTRCAPRPRLGRRRPARRHRACPTRSSRWSCRSPRSPNATSASAGTLRPAPGTTTPPPTPCCTATATSRADWLRAGEALSEVWLTATEHGAAVLPLSSPVELDFTRQALRRMLGEHRLPVPGAAPGHQRP